MNGTSTNHHNEHGKNKVTPGKNGRLGKKGLPGISGGYVMRGGALDRNDPNYFSSSDEEDLLEDSSYGAQQAPEVTKSLSASSSSSHPEGFKKIDLHTLFKASPSVPIASTTSTTSSSSLTVPNNVVSASSSGPASLSGTPPSSSTTTLIPTSSSSSTTTTTSTTVTSSSSAEPYAGGAHQTNVPEARHLPMPQMTTPQKNQQNGRQLSGAASPSPSPQRQPSNKDNNAARMEQSLKAMLNIQSAQ